MKYIKNLKDFWRGDIVTNNYNEQLYLIVDDVFENDHTMRAFHIGNFIKTYNRNKLIASLIFNRKNNVVIINKNEYFPIGKKKRTLVYDSVSDNTYSDYLNVIKDKTGIDIKETLAYKEYLIEKDVKKYNI